MRLFLSFVFVVTHIKHGGLSLFSLCHQLLMGSALWCGSLVAFVSCTSWSESIDLAATWKQLQQTNRKEGNRCTRSHNQPAVSHFTWCGEKSLCGQRLLPMIWSLLASFWEWKKKYINSINQFFRHRVSSYQVTYQRSFSADVSLFWEWFVHLFYWQTPVRKPTREHFLHQWQII